MKRSISLKSPVLIALIFILVLAIVIPSASAFESYKVNVRARIQQFCGKTYELAAFADLVYAGDALPGDPNNLDYVIYYGHPCALSSEGDLGCAEWDEDDNAWSIPLKTCVAWVVNIYVSNPYDYVMQNVRVHDNFNAEVKVAFIGASQGSYYFVDLTGGDTVGWDIGNLSPNGSATLTLLVWTKYTYECKELGNGNIKCKVHQCYTSTGTYAINESGVTVKWYDDSGSQQSYNTGPLLPVIVE